MDSQNDNKKIETPVADASAKSAVPSGEKLPERQRSFQSGFFGRQKNERRGRNDRAPRQEYDQKIINIRRVARVATGGKRFSFSVAMILGNRNGSVGVGTGKGADTALAIDKAIRDAKKNMIEIHLTKTKSITRPVDAKYSSARIMLMPAPGRGIAAGSALRSVIELAGISDITTKIISPSKNGLNVARAAIVAFSKLPGTKKKSSSVSKPTPVKSF